MGSIARAFHHGAKPISAAEFKDAVEAICPPRFPTARYAQARYIVMAISGGVDSMAMAFLFARHLRTFRGAKIADNPSYNALAVVVDHGLRDGSGHEAAQVAKELRKLGIRVKVRELSWKKERQQGLEPRNLPNVEGLARTYRYQALGNVCSWIGSTNLFFAHHADDQYETLLMRIIAGHGYRGLQGIRDANSIPECYDMHGVYKSGLLDDQMRVNPSLSFKPPNREMRRLRAMFRDEKKQEGGSECAHVSMEDLVNRFPMHPRIQPDPQVPFLKPLDTEDGGTMVYRPLLEFDKDRLIATCEANGIQWFEDNTNLDPTLTTRNAIRHLVRNYELPKALQKPAILGLCKRARRKVQHDVAEAHRFLVREAVIQNFDPNAGTLLVRPPSLRTAKSQRKRRSLDLDVEARRDHVKLITTIAVRKLIDFVTPEYHLPPLNNLDNVVHRLFPDLSPESEPSAPKAFSIAGVLLDPFVTGSTVEWRLSRAPYPSNKPLPCDKLHGPLATDLRPPRREAEYYRWGQADHLGNSYHPSPRALAWRKAKLFDGRFWIRIGINNRALVQVRPFQPEYAKTLRKSLPGLGCARLERLLKHYAPGKVRYTLPALYCMQQEKDADTEDYIWTSTLLALPTLGVHVPGMERWVRYEVRYKKVDNTLLGHQPRAKRTGAMGHRRSPGTCRGRRQEQVSRWREKACRVTKHAM